MLPHKDDVEAQANSGQAQFHWIADQTRPVPLQRAVNDELQQTKNSSKEIKEDLYNTPAEC